MIDLELRLDGEAVASETTCTWGGAYVLTIHSVIPRADLALELHSTFVGQAGAETHAVHLRLGPSGHSPSLITADHAPGELDPVRSPRTCAYEHAQRLIEILDEFGYRASVNVPGEQAFSELERTPRPPF